MKDLITCPPSPTLNEKSTIRKWHVKNGSKVEKGQVILELETSNLYCEVPASISGIISGIAHSEGASVERDELLCVIESHPSGKKQHTTQ